VRRGKDLSNAQRITMLTQESWAYRSDRACQAEVGPERV